MLSDELILSEDDGEIENGLIILGGKGNKEWSMMQAALILSQIDPFNANQWNIRLEIDDFKESTHLKRVIVTGSFESDCWNPTDDIWNASRQKLSDLAKSLPEAKFAGFGVAAGLLA